MEPEPPSGLADSSSAEQRLSYKFQRLRERIRAAIASGELVGKLPGERELARRFKVNTKTLSKALTELAADGLVERNIGLGTFVRGSQPRDAQRALFISNASRCEGIPQHLDSEVVQLTSHSDSSELPPSLLNRFDTIVVASDRVPDDLIRDMVVRGKRVITIGRRPAVFVTKSILLDDAAAAASLAQRLVHRGHKKLLLLGYDADGEIVGAIRGAIADASIHIESGQLTELADALNNGCTGVIVMPPIDPKQAITHASRIGFDAPSRISVVAVGWQDTPPCSGLFVHCSQAAQTLAALLDQPASGRPVQVWLVGDFIDQGTLGPAPVST